MQLWNLLALFMFGCALTEFSGRTLINLEYNGDYRSPLHYVLVGTITLGLTLAVCSILTIIQRMEKINGECDGKVKLITSDKH